MRTNSNNLFSSLSSKGVFVKALALLTGFHILALSYFHQEIQLIDTPHAVNQSEPLEYTSKDWTDRKSVV